MYVARQRTCHVKHGTWRRLMAFNRERFDLNVSLTCGSQSHIKYSSELICEAFDNLLLAGCLTAYLKQCQENANGHFKKAIGV